MKVKKHKSSEVKWDEQSNAGVFLITSNKGKSAKGFIKKSSDGNLIALIEDTDYADTYRYRKVRDTLKAIFENEPMPILVQESIDCLPGYIYTDSGEAGGLVPNESHTITGTYRHYCVNGAYDCGGETYQGPISVIYKGAVIGVCAGVAVEYAKFKIN